MSAPHNQYQEGSLNIPKMAEGISTHPHHSVASLETNMAHVSVGVPPVTLVPDTEPALSTGKTDIIDAAIDFTGGIVGRLQCDIHSCHLSDYVLISGANGSRKLHTCN